jgi:guanosine-3',5'-bis(diphosphate) 3'-pyrophosphohydrolase
MLVIKAIQFASEKHKGQERRGSGLPYVTHPIIVMELVQKYKGTSKHIDELKCAALLHDTLEDTETSYGEIEREFTPLVASIVMELTSDSIRINEIGKNEYLKEKMEKMSQYAFTLKLLDRLSNVMDGPTKKYLKDTLKLMEHLTAKREDITDRQVRIMQKIVVVCKTKEGELMASA